MNLKALLKRYTVNQLKEAIRLKAQAGRVEVLEAKKTTLLKQVQKIDRQLSKLNGNGATTAKPGGKRGYKLSASTRAKMRASALKRHAKNKPKAPKTARKTRKLSAAGRAAISTAAKARWAKVRGAQAEPKAEATTVAK